MKLGKYIFCSFALATGLVAFAPINAMAARHQVCHTVHHHGHATRDCHWVH